MVEIFQNQMKKLMNELSKEQLSKIHYGSVSNFLQYFNQLKGDSLKQEILILLENYFEKIKELNYELNKDESQMLYDNYLMKVGTYYNSELRFQVYMQPKWALFIGLNVDVVLLIFGLLKKVYYIPIVTILFCGYFIYLKMKYGRQNKLYGYGY